MEHNGPPEHCALITVISLSKKIVEILMQSIDIAISECFVKY